MERIELFANPRDLVIQARSKDTPFTNAGVGFSLDVIKTIDRRR